MSEAVECTCLDTTDFAPSHARLLEEVLRYSCACRLAQRLASLVAEELPDGCDSRGLMTASIFESVQWSAIHHTHGEMKREDKKEVEVEEECREWVHPVLDVHGGVCVRSVDGDVMGQLDGIELTKGTVLARLRPDPNACAKEGKSKSNASCLIPLEQLRLVRATPIYRDILLPAPECITPSRTSRTAMHWFLEKLCGASSKMLTSFNHKRRRAWELADRLTILFFEERRHLAELRRRLRQADASEVKITRISLDSSDGDMVSLRICLRDASVDKWFRAACPAASRKGSGAVREQEELDVCVTFELEAVHLTRLRRRGVCALGAHFNVALALLLLRYAGLSGGAWRPESGWHAGLPHSVFDALVEAFGVSTECFASPFNCTLPKYFSAFPDTDRFFGGGGNFFDPKLLRWDHNTTEEVKETSNKNGIVTDGIAFEANPPFDHTVIAAAFIRALQCLTDAPATMPVTFVFVVPDSSQPKGVVARQAAEESSFFRGSCVIAPIHAPYVDGARHVETQRRKRRRDADETDQKEENNAVEEEESELLVTLSCSTRLMVLQNEAASTTRSALGGLERVQAAWKALQSSDD